MMAKAKAQLEIGWKKGAQFANLDARRVYRELEDIRSANGGNCEPGDVLAAAQANSDLEIAKAIEWDEKPAAERWRLEQIKHLIRGLSVREISVQVLSHAVAPRRALVHVRPSPGVKSYVPREVAIRSHAEELRRRARKSLESWLVQYGDVPGLDDLVETIRAALNQEAA